jgi:hypothetical protein
VPVASVLGADYDDIKHDIARIQPEARALKAALAMFSEHAVYGIEDSIADRADDLAELRKAG